MTAVYFQECRSLEARELKNTSKSWVTYFSCVLPHMLLFFFFSFWASISANQGNHGQCIHLQSCSSQRLSPQTLTQVFGLLTYRFTVPSISPTNKNKEPGLLLEALNQEPCDLLLAQTHRHNLVSPANKLHSQSWPSDRLHKMMIFCSS